MAKRYYWLKLKEDFFEQKIIKKLRRIAGGDTYTIIYLKLQLLAMKNDGKLFFEYVEKDFANELALELDEDVENVEGTLFFLEKNKLLEVISQEEYFLPEVLKAVESESASTQRVREFREREKQKELLQCNANVIQGNKMQQLCSVEKEKDIDKDHDHDNNILNNINIIKNIPTFIVHGSHDLICWPINSYLLHKNMNNSKLYFIENAGHSQREEYITKKLVEITDSLIK